MRYTLAILLAFIALLVIAAKADAATRLPGYACPTPHGHVSWHFKPDGCIVIAGNRSAILPRAATEVEVWSSNLKRHLTQTYDTYPGSDACPQWGFDANGYALGWVTCNRDLFNYGPRAVIAYYWEG